MDVMNEKEIQSLIKLLDDPNKEVYQIVRERLFTAGADVVPRLEKAWDTAYDEITHERIEDLIHEIQLNETIKLLKDWRENDNADLLKGAWALATYQYPELEYEEVQVPIEKVKQEAWIEINNNLTAFEKIKILNYTIFNLFGFGKNSRNFYSPKSSFINVVLESKQGNPISLAIVYAAVAQRLGLPVYGVNLPKNFVLAYKDEQVYSNMEGWEDEMGDETLFYINPYHKGAVFGHKEIDYYLKQQKIDPQKKFYRPASNVDTIQRLLLHLLFSFQKEGSPEKIEDMQKLLRGYAGTNLLSEGD